MANGMALASQRSTVLLSHELAAFCPCWGIGYGAQRACYGCCECVLWWSMRWHCWASSMLGAQAGALGGEDQLWRLEFVPADA